jgi:AcrR family transcriptional regulator
MRSAFVVTTTTDDSEGANYDQVMGYRHSRDDLLAAGERVALSRGIAAITFASVGKEAGTSDRTVVYYFPTKADLVGAVIASLGAQLQDVLAEAFGDEPLPTSALVRRAWPALANPEVDAVFAVFFQVLGLATAKAEPYASLATLFVSAWIDWVAPRIDAPTPAARRRAATAAMAQLDGLLLLRSVSGARVANDAARELGIRD